MKLGKDNTSREAMKMFGKYGVEIEMTGLTRDEAAKVIRRALREIGKDNTGWNVARDSSIEATSEAKQVEVVTPPMKWEEIGALKHVVKRLREAGAEVNKSCGIHVHVDGSSHTPKTVKNLVNLMARWQEVLIEALEVHPSRLSRYTRRISDIKVEEINGAKDSWEDIKNAWYRGCYDNRTWKYNETRYHTLNLHSLFYRGTVEFRLFNATLDEEKIGAYIMLAMAMNNAALKMSSRRRKKAEHQTTKDAVRHLLWELGIAGEEYRTYRRALMGKYYRRAA